MPTSVELPAQSLTIQIILVSAQPRAAICSFHELEQPRLRMWARIHDALVSTSPGLKSTYARLAI